MSVRVTVEGGGSFELDDRDIKHLRRTETFGGWVGEIFDHLTAALPPEPYQPKEGDRVQYRYRDHGSPIWSSACDYFGTWRGWHALRRAGDTGDTPPFLEHPSVEFRRAES